MSPISSTLITMAKNSKSNELRLPLEEGASEALSMARSVLQPTVQAATSLIRFENKFGDLDLTSLVEALTEQTSLAIDGDMSRAEAMLATQAHTLDAIFNNLAQRAALNMGEYIDTVDTYLKLALRAQSQCRSTWEALSAIKNPPLAGYVKQANIAHGHQQVNNGPVDKAATSRTGEKENAQNKLLEAKDGKRLDTGTARTASGINQDMETVETIDRPKDK